MLETLSRISPDLAERLKDVPCTAPENWKSPPRVKNPKAIKAAKAGGKCENKNCKFRVGPNNPLETHHKTLRSQRGGDEPSNLMAICRNCHMAYHNDPTVKRDIQGQLNQLAACAGADSSVVQPVPAVSSDIGGEA